MSGDLILMLFSATVGSKIENIFTLKFTIIIMFFPFFWNLKFSLHVEQEWGVGWDSLKLNFQSSIDSGKARKALFHKWTQFYLHSRKVGLKISRKFVFIQEKLEFKFDIKIQEKLHLRFLANLSSFKKSWTLNFMQTSSVI